MEDLIDHLIRSSLVCGIRVSLLTQDIRTSGHQDIGTCPCRSGDYLFSCCGGFEPGDAQHAGAGVERRDEAVLRVAR